MEEPSYMDPGFPVYKALTVPILEDGKPKHIVEVSRDFVEKSWREVLSGLREYINSFTYFTQLITRPSEKKNTYEYYETLADIIALYFRQPLQLDPIPSTMVSPLKAYTIVRKIKLVYDVYRDDPIETLKLLPKPHQEYEQFRPEVIEALAECWLKLPADTRPGYNTSGLTPHLLTTSAIAWALAVEKNLGREEAAKARLASLLHDMSKPFNYRKHWKITDKIVEHVLDRKVLGSEFVDEISKLVKEHHIDSGDALGNIIHSADVIASSVDRLNVFTEKILRPELGDRFDVLYGSGEAAWGEWEKLERENNGKIKELSLKFVEEISKPETFKEVYPETKGGEEYEKLLYFLVDVGGIQEFIFRTVDLRTVTASSYAIDFLTSAYVMMGIQHHLNEKVDVWVPVEAFLINGGGKLSFIAPEALKYVIKKSLEEIGYNLMAKLGLSIYFGYTNLSDSFTDTDTKTASMVNLQKITHDKIAYLEFPTQNLCNHCYVKPAETKIINGKDVCNTCAGLFDIGDEYHFKSKWSAEIFFLPEKVKISGIKTPYESTKDPMYVIAGHSPSELDDLQKREGRKRNVAVVKFDANMMGRFFAKSISLTDALERSWRVDMSMKMAYQKALCDLYKAVCGCDSSEQAELAVRQCYLGTLYMGGDDGLIICPSWASIPLAVGISRYFNERMGGALTLSVGLAATTPEHDVWSSIEAASALLDKAKKEAGRKIKTSSDGFGALCFDIIEGGTLSRSAVNSRYNELNNEGLTVQPFTLGGDAGIGKLDTILEDILDVQALELHSLFRKCWEASRGESDKSKRKELNELLKRIRSALRESPEIVRTHKELSIKLSFTYVSRQASRLEDGKDSSVKAYKLIVNAVREYLLRGGDKLRTPLSDIDRLIKIVGGGVI